MLRRLMRVARDPGFGVFRAAAAWTPGALHSRYQRLARAQGFDRLYFVLSFDCDTDLDIEVAPAVDEKLRAVGITPVYAVPGELLERGATVYRALADAGAEFMNHGYVEHTSLDRATHTYVSTVFYDLLTPEQVADDVRRGHAAVTEVIGRAPTGFRAPHFGTYHRAAQLRHLHAVLKPLGYRYTSSTPPLSAYRLGPAAHFSSGIVEFPVTGCVDEPHRILDSWSFRYAPGASGSLDAYVAEAGRLGAHFASAGRVGFINLYADPSQVYDWPGFFDAMALFAPFAAPSYNHVLTALDT